ncbi:MAG: glycosyltransferase family 2 protein [Nitrospirota bacterium]
MTPMVSVLMAVRNGLPFVRDAVASILDQSFRDFEFLIIDDGSTDGTSAFLGAIGDSRVRLIRQEWGGLTRSLIRGLAEARGEYVARQDADDVSRPDRLGKQVVFLEANPDVLLVGSGGRLVSERGDVLRSYHYPTRHKQLVEDLERLTSPLPHTTIMFRRAEILACGGYRAVFRKAQDYDLYLRVAERGRLASLPEPLCDLRCSMTSVTSAESDGEQFFYAVLALLCYRARRAGKRDPIDRAADGDGLRGIRAWYESSRYPKVFRSRQLRRRARLAWSEGSYAEAAGCIIQSVGSDPGWVLNRCSLGGPILLTPEVMDALEALSSEGHEYVRHRGISRTPV